MSTTGDQGRVIALIDMDCFYVQVEQRENPALKGQPCAVVQYNKWKGGGIIAVGYEARACGVTRQMRGDDARQKCPHIQLVHVPEVRGKADLTKYRDAGAEVIDVLCRHCKLVERASVDEAYLDLTDEVTARLASLDSTVNDAMLPNTHVIGFEDTDQTDKDERRRQGVSAFLTLTQSDDDGDAGDTTLVTSGASRDDCHHARRLAIAASIVEQMRQAVYDVTGFRCSAGIAHNKMLSKLACGVNKPNKQTILPQTSVHELFNTLPIRKIRNLGGKFGTSLVQDFGAEFMGDLVKYNELDFSSKYGEKSGKWLYLLCRGIEHEPVIDRLLPKSISCGKNFTGKERLDSLEKVRYWVTQLSTELEERLRKDQDKNKRTARQLGIYVRHLTAVAVATNTDDSISASRSCALVRYDAERIAQDALVLLQKFNSASANTDSPGWFPPIVSLAMSTGKFEDQSSTATSSIRSFFNQSASTSMMSTSATANISNGQQVSSASATSRPMPPEKNGINGDVPTCKSTDAAPVGVDGSVGGNLSTGRGLKRKLGPMHQYLNTSSCSQTVTSFNSQTVTLDVENTDISSDASKKLCLSSAEATQESVTRRVQADHVTAEEKSRAASATVTTAQQQACQPVEGFFARYERLRLQRLAESSANVTESRTCSDDFRDTNISRSKLLTSNGKKRDESSAGLVTQYDAEDYIQCDKCQQQIVVWEMPEHSDYHYAMELQKEVRQNSVRRVDKAPSLPPSANRGRSKRQSDVPNNVPSIRNFFNKK